MLGQLEVLGAIQPPPVLSTTESLAQRSTSIGSDAAKSKYQELLTARPPPVNLGQALELEVARLHGGLLPSQRRSFLTSRGGSEEAYLVTAHIPSGHEAGDARKAKGGWSFTKLLQGGSGATPELEYDPSENARQQALCQEAVALLRSHAQVPTQAPAHSLPLGHAYVATGPRTCCHYATHMLPPGRLLPPLCHECPLTPC